MPIDTSNIIPPDISFNGVNARPISTVNITTLKPKTPNNGINELIARSKEDPKKLSLSSTTLIVTEDTDELQIVDEPIVKESVKLLIPIKTKESGVSLLKDIDVNRISASRKGKNVYTVDDLKRIAKRYSLPTSGNKGELVTRIEKYLRDNGIDLEAERSKTPTERETIDLSIEDDDSDIPSVEVIIEDIPKRRRSPKGKEKE